MKLSAGISQTAYDRTYRGDPKSWRSAVIDICARERVDCSRIVPFDEGANLVVAVSDQLVLKIFPPFHGHQWKSEHRVLSHLSSAMLGIDIPRLVAAGEKDHWNYVILTLLKGVPLHQVWRGISYANQAALLRQIGQIMAAVHAVSAEPLHNLEPRWAAFLEDQATRCLRHHQDLGAPQWFLEGLDFFVSQSLSLLPSSFRPVILTGEYTPFNLLVEVKGGLTRITGMIDFGDAMIGYHEYDLLGPSLFLAQGNSELIKSLLSGYGYPDAAMTSELRRRLMLLQVLHRYSDLSSQLSVAHWQERVKTLPELEALIWSF
jgi:hygromycin-B 7''-O-kinase